MANITTNSIKVKWAQVAGALEYRIDVAINPDFTNFVFNYRNRSVKTNEITINGLSPGTVYYIRVRSVNSIGQGPNSSTVVRSTLANPPSNISFSDITNNSFKITWPVMNGAINYSLDISKNSDFTSFVNDNENKIVNSNTINISNLESGITYFVRIRSLNINNKSSVNSAIFSKVTIPRPPDNIQALNITQNSLTLFWSRVPGATKYFYDISLDPNFSTFGENTRNQEIFLNTVNLGGVTNDFWNSDRTYYIRIRSANSSGSSINSYVFDVTLTLGSPIISVSNIETSSCSINWSPINGAVNYTLDISKNSTFTDIIQSYQNKIINSTTEDVNSLEIGTNYYVRVKANKNNSDSEYGITAFLTKPNPPSQVSYTINEGTSFNLNWGIVPQAISYNIDIARDSSFTDYLVGWENKNVTTNNVIVNNATNNTTYFIRVKANTKSISTNYSSILQFTLTYNPVLSLVYANENEIKVSWNSLPNIRDVNFNVWNFTDPFGNKRFRVKIIPSTICSERLLGGFRAIGAITETEKSLSEKFMLIKGTGIYNEVSRSYPYQRIEIGRSYYITANIISNSLNNYNSNTLIITPTPLPPNNLSINIISNSGVNIVFPQNDYCINNNNLLTYKLDISENSSFNSFVGDYQNKVINVGEYFSRSFETQTPTGLYASQNLTYPITGLSAGSLYYLRIKSCANKDNYPESEYTIKNFYTYTNNISNFNFSNISSNSFNFSWPSVNNVNYYLVDVSTNSGFSNFIKGLQNYKTYNNQLLINGLEPGTSYFVRTRNAIDSLNVSPYSVISQVKTSPNYLDFFSFSNLESTSFKINWPNIFGATYYILDVSTGSNFNNYVNNYQNKVITNWQGNLPQTTVSGLNSNTEYFVRIKTANEDSINENAPLIQSIKTLNIPAPTIINISNITTNSFKISWNNVNEANSYRLDVSIDPNFQNYVGGYQNRLITNGLEENVSNLTNNTTYYVRIRSVGILSTSNNSNTQTVKTLSLSSSSSSIDSLATVSNIFILDVEYTSFLIKWDKVIGAESYRLDVSKDANFQNFIPGYLNKEIKLTNELVTGLTPGTTYYLRIRSINSNSISQYSKLYSVKTNSPIIAAPFVSDLENNFKIHFYKVPGYPWVRFEIDEVESFDYRQQNFDIEMTSDSTFNRVSNTFGSEINSFNNTDGLIFTIRNFFSSTPPLLEPGVKHYLRVRYSKVRPGYFGPFDFDSPIYNFTTLPYGYNAENIILSNITTTGVKVEWSGAHVKGDNRYKLYIGRYCDEIQGLNSILDNFVVGYNGKIVNQRFENISNLTPGSLYFMKISPGNEFGYQPRTSVKIFSTIPVSITGSTSFDLTSNSVKIKPQGSRGQYYISNNSKWYVESGLNYVLDVAKDSNFNNIVYQNWNPMGLNISDTPIINIENLESNTNYYFRFKTLLRIDYGSIKFWRRLSSVNTTLPIGSTICPAFIAGKSDFIENQSYTGIGGKTNCWYPYFDNYSAPLTKISGVNTNYSPTFNFKTLNINL